MSGKISKQYLVLEVRWVRPIASPPVRSSLLSGSWKHAPVSRKRDGKGLRWGFTGLG